MKPPISGDQPLSAQYGYPEEWAAFSERHQEFLKRFKNIEQIIQTAFTRIQSTKGPLEKIIYLHGRLIVEDFMEILLLCGNGYGIAAQKVLRGMYERAVTTHYLKDNPNEAQLFLEFHRVSDYKYLIAVEESMGKDVFSPEQAEKIRQEYESVKEKFRVSACKHCPATRINYTWSKLDFVNMAKKVESLWPLIMTAYYFPTREAHATIGAIFSRLDRDAAVRDEGLIFTGESQRDRAHGTLRTAHYILLDIVELEQVFFAIEPLKSELETCHADFNEIWKGETAD